MPRGGAKGSAERRKAMNGTTDTQYADHLKALISELELVKKLGVSKEAEDWIDGMISQYKSTIEL